MDSEIKEECRKPRANIIRREEKYIIKIEMPGLSKEHIDLSIVGETLEIFGERTKVKYEKGLGGFVRREFEGPIYYREFQLPKNIIEDKIEAKMKWGVLKITIPLKKVEGKKKRIALT
ncbi:MAG: Hsp20/alpha crystallin family protein [Promethearchaeia archaeon]